MLISKQNDTHIETNQSIGVALNWTLISRSQIETLWTPVLIEFRFRASDQVRVHITEMLESTRSLHSLDI